MLRLLSTGLGAAALCAGWLAVAPVPVRAGDERRIAIFRSSAAHLGVMLRDVESADVAKLKLPEERGAVVKEVLADTPAQKAGLREGDVILRYQGTEIQSVAQLVRLVRETPPGRKVAIEASRDGATQKLSATLEESKGEGMIPHDILRDLEFEVPLPPLPPQPPAPPMRERLRLRDLWGDRGPRKLGIEYQDISGQLAKYFRLADDRGVLVVSVDEEGPAGKAGIKAGDIVLKLDGKAVRDGGHLRDELERFSPGQEVTVSVQRDGKPLDFKVKLGSRAEPRRPGDET